MVQPKILREVQQQNARVSKQMKHSLLVARLTAEMMIDVFSFVSTVNTGYMDDVSKVVIPNSEGEEGRVCKCYSEVHGVKEIEE
jgi:hypothetical protein